MLQKKMRLGTLQRLAIFFSALATFLGCDPCRELAERRCRCKSNDKEINKCMQDLNRYTSLRHAQDEPKPEVCLKVLKECPCPDLVSGDDSKCGVYRQ